MSGNLWTPGGVGRYSDVKTWCMRNARTRELRYVDCVTRLALLAEPATAESHWVTRHASEYYPS